MLSWSSALSTNSSNLVSVALQAPQVSITEGLFLCFIQFAFLLFPPKLYNAFPSVVKFLPGAHHTIFRNVRLLKSFVKERIDKHKEDWNPSESRDFIDCYLQEIAKVSTAEQTPLQRGLEIQRDKK